MKNWQLPVAAAEKFAANDYVAACWQIKCAGPNNNAYCTNLFADDNGNGQYDVGETSIANPPYEGARFKACGGYQLVKGEGEPQVNGFVEQDGQYLPVFYWLGDVMNPTELDGEMADFHYTDLTQEGAFYHDPRNHS